MAINKVDVMASIVWAPLFVFEIFVFALSLGFILSALFVRLRDISYIWEVLLQALFYATPIIYPLSMVSDKWPAVAKAMLMNPIAQAVQDIRYDTVTKQTQTISTLAHGWHVLIPFTIVAITLGIAITLFKRRSPYFAEEV
jgi:ABC-2 type transport system permease protein